MFFSTQGNMKKRDLVLLQSPVLMLRQGMQGWLKLLMTLKTKGGGKGEPTNVSKKAKITSVRELGQTSKPPNKITKKKQDQDDLTWQFINILQNEDKAKEEDEIDMALGAIGIRIKRSLNKEQ